MKLPTNAINEEKERFAYINGDVYTAKLYQELVEAEQREKMYTFNTKQTREACNLV